MAMQRLRVAIIGGGGVGTAAARVLAREGHSVRVFEQFSIDHDKGSSYGASRIVRKTYPDRLYTQLMNAAYPLWADLEREAGKQLFVRCGGLYFGPEGHEELREIEDALVHNAVPYEKLSPDESHARFPALRLMRGEVSIFQADSGFVNASAVVRSQAALARQHGAEIKENVKVLQLTRDRSAHRGGLHIKTTAGDFEADRLLICAGPWLSQLHPGAARHLTVTRQQYVYLKIARNPQHFQPANMPVWLKTRADDGCTHGDMYGFPADGEVEGVKFAKHVMGPTVSPDHVDRTLDAEHAKELIDYARERMPDLSSEISVGKTCLYTNTPDADFLIDAMPDLPGAYYIGGLSGHGFKFIPLLGRIGADLVTDKTPPYDLSRFLLSRFQ